MTGSNNAAKSVLEQRVDVLEAGQTAILGKLDGLASSLAEGKRTPWALVVSVIGTGVVVIGAIAGLAFRPLAEGQSRLETAVLAITSKIEVVDRTAHESFVGKGEFATILGAVKDRRDDAQRVIEDRFKRAEADIDALQKAVVPRGEHERQWADQRRLDDGQADAIKDLRHRLESDYMPKEALDLLLRRLDDLERRFNARTG